MEDDELEELFMDKWVIVGTVCGVILAVVVITALISLLVCFVWQRKKEPKTNGNRSGRRSQGKSGSDSDKSARNGYYAPSMMTATQPYYVQPSEGSKLAPSAEMLHYQYQREHSTPPPPYPMAPTMPTSASSQYIYEVPGLAVLENVKEVKNPLYDK